MGIKKPDAKDSSTAKGASTISVSKRLSILGMELARKAVQLLSFTIFNAAFLSLPLAPIVLPVLHSLGFPYKIIGEAFGAVQWMLYDLVFPWLPLASIFIFAVLTGRFLCGWVCPFGFVNDLLNYDRGERISVSPQTHKDLIKVKYLILGLTLFISSVLAVASTTSQGRTYRRMLGVFAEAPFSTLSPSDTLFAIVPRVALEIWYRMPFYFYGNKDFLSDFLSVSTLLWVRIVIMLAVFVLSVYVPRAWCRYFCPQGAFSALISRFSFLGLRRDPIKCMKAGCRICVDTCPMKVPILNLPWEKFTDSECIYCLKCVASCPTKAIKLKFP